MKPPTLADFKADLLQWIESLDSIPVPQVSSGEPLGSPEGGRAWFFSPMALVRYTKDGAQTWQVRVAEGPVETLGEGVYNPKCLEVLRKRIGWDLK